MTHFARGQAVPQRQHKEVLAQSKTSGTWLSVENSAGRITSRPRFSTRNTQRMRCRRPRVGRRRQASTDVLDESPSREDEFFFLIGRLLNEQEVNCSERLEHDFSRRLTSRTLPRRVSFPSQSCRGQPGHGVCVLTWSLA
jgi:hypothetical protein